MDLQTKIQKYIINQPGVKFYKESPAGSMYYRIHNYVIRLSNHLNGYYNDRNILNIVINDNDEITFIVTNKIYHVTYETLKERIRNYIIFAEMFKPIIIKKKKCDRLDITIDDDRKIVVYGNNKFKFKHLSDELWNKLRTNLTKSTPRSVEGFYNVIADWEKVKV